VGIIQEYEGPQSGINAASIILDRSTSIPLILAHVLRSQPLPRVGSPWITKGIPIRKSAWEGGIAIHPTCGNIF